MVNYALTTSGLCKRYGRNRILDNVSLSVPANSIYGLIGENGAGKTTLFRIFAGLSQQTSGTFSIGPSAAPQAPGKIGFMIEAPALYPHMTVLQNLYVQQLQCTGRKDPAKAAQVLETVGLKPQEAKKARHLSLGMKQRLAFAIAILNDPEILILDEPMNGLDPLGMIAFRELLLTMHQRCGITMIVATHILSELEHIATHYGFLHSGRLLREMPASAIPHAPDALACFYKQLLEDRT